MRSQASLGGKYKPNEKPMMPMHRLAYGHVVQTFPSSDMVKVQLNDLSTLPACPYLKDFAAGSGEKVRLPAKGSLVLVGFIDGRKDSPVVLGVIKNASSKVKPSAELEWIDKHPSGAETKIKANGDISIKSAGGVKIDIVGTKITIDGDNIVLKCGTAVKLGSDAATIKAVLGDNLKTAYDSHTHTGNLGFPTSPPSSPLPTNALSTKIKLE